MNQQTGPSSPLAAAHAAARAVASSQSSRPPCRRPPPEKSPPSASLLSSSSPPEVAASSPPPSHFLLHPRSQATAACYLLWPSPMLSRTPPRSAAPCWPPSLAATPDLPSSPSPLPPHHHCSRTHRASCRDPPLLPISLPPSPTLRSSCPLTVARSRRCFTHAVAGHGVLQHRQLCCLFSVVHLPKPPRPPFLFSTSSFPLLPTRTDPKLSASLLPHLLLRKHHCLPPPPFIHGPAHSSFTHVESLLMAAHASKPIGSPCHHHEPRLLLLPSFLNPLSATMVPYGLILNRHPLSQSHPWLPPACCLFPSPFLLPITTISTFGLLLSSFAHCFEPQAIRPPYIFFSYTNHRCSSPPCCRLCHHPIFLPSRSAISARPSSTATFKSVWEKEFENPRIPGTNPTQSVIRNINLTAKLF